MCGIAGLISRGTPSPIAVEQMTRGLTHRGPDGAAVRSLDGAVLGHRRLAILDLTRDGSQPMWDASGRYCISYNGEIYNWRELREESISGGAVYRSQTDTEVVLNTYALRGPAAFSRLRGMFAFCLYDTIQETAYFVRDRAGIKPLYIARTADGLYFSSELGPLIDSGAVPFEVDQRSLQSFLRLDYVPTPWSLVRNVEKLNAGEVLEYSASGERSFTLDEVPLEPLPGVDSDPVAQFGKRIESVVARQMVADVPVGVFLSGGIDSTIVAAVAARLRGNVDTFSIGFAEQSFDERDFARVVARQLGTRHHEHVVEPGDLLETISRLPVICSEPIADGSILPTYALCSFARQHVKVALSGDGADELFGGYPLYRLGTAAAVFSRMPGVVRAGLEAALRRAPVRYENLTLSYKAQRFLRGLTGDEILRHHRWLGTFLPEQLRFLLRNHRAEHDMEIDALLLAEVERHQGLAALMRSDERFYLQDQVLVKADRASMANSLEVRVPFLDEELVAFARWLPPSLKVRGARSKVLLRTFLSGEFPEQIWKRPKKGFGAPLGKWFRGPLRELLHDTVGSAAVVQAGFFQPRYIARLLHEHDAGLADHRKELFNLLTFSLWFTHWQGAARVAVETGAPEKARHE